MDMMKCTMVLACLSLAMLVAYTSAYPFVEGEDDLDSTLSDSQQLQFLTKELMDVLEDEGDDAKGMLTKRSMRPRPRCNCARLSAGSCRRCRYHQHLWDRDNPIVVDA